MPIRRIGTNSRTQRVNDQQSAKIRNVAERIVVPVDAEMLERIKDYWHERRFNNRSEAVRRLIQIGLEVESKNLGKR